MHLHRWLRRSFWFFCVSFAEAAPSQLRRRGTTSAFSSAGPYNTLSTRQLSCLLFLFEIVSQFILFLIFFHACFLYVLLSFFLFNFWLSAAARVVIDRITTSHQYRQNGLPHSPRQRGPAIHRPEMGLHQPLRFQG